MKRFHYLFVVGAVAAFVWFSATPAQAEGPVDKLKRGLAGIMFGGLEVPGTLCEECRNQGWPLGVSVGFFKATGNFAAREVTGIFEFLTAPIPWPNEDYKSYMDTAYPWDRFHTTKEAPVVPPPPTIPQSPPSTTPQPPPAAK